MSGTQYGIILVYSTSHALKAEKVLNKEGIPNKLIPVPRRISSNCGSCIRVEGGQLERAHQLLEAARVGIEGMHKI